ncbi:hypothetical protein IMX07_10325 [bacterium]|nr:hypothetical protein [bacterium]
MRYRRNDYSAPTAYGHREVLVRGHVHEVVIACGAEEVAHHPRSHGREDFILNPPHYLALLEQKIGALDQAAPLVDRTLPEEVATLRRLFEDRLGKPGRREFVQVLRLLEVFRLGDVAAAVKEAIARGVLSFDAVKHLVLCRIQRRPLRLDLKVYPYLPQAAVGRLRRRALVMHIGGRPAVSGGASHVSLNICGVVRLFSVLFITGAPEYGKTALSTDQARAFFGKASSNSFVIVLHCKNGVVYSANYREQSENRHYPDNDESSYRSKLR